MNIKTLLSAKMLNLTLSQKRQPLKCIVVMPFFFFIKHLTFRI